MYSGSGDRVNAVAPAGVKTNIEAPFKSEHAGRVLGPVLDVLALTPAEPEQIAAAITWRLSDDSSNVSGVVLASDGGWSAV